MEGANLYSLMLQANGRQNPNPNPNPNSSTDQPPSNLHANNYGLPLFGSTMANPMNNLINYTLPPPPPQIIFLSVPDDATIVFTRRSSSQQRYSSSSSPLYSINIDNNISPIINAHLGLNSTTPRIAPRSVLPSGLRQAPLPLPAPSGHDDHQQNSSTARRSNMHELIDLNKAPINTDSEADEDGDKNNIDTTTDLKYKCQQCMIEFPSPQAYGRHMSFHCRQNRAQFEVGESSRPWKKTRTDEV